jgi:hypothetical protein
LEKVVSALNVAAVVKTVGDTRPLFRAVPPHELQQPLLVRKGPLLVGEAGIKAPRPPLLALRAVPIPADKICNRPPAIQAEPVDSSEQAIVLGL